MAKKLSINDELLEKEKQMKHYQHGVEIRLKQTETESKHHQGEVLRLAEESEKLSDRADEVCTVCMVLFITHTYTHIYIVMYMYVNISWL